MASVRIGATKTAIKRFIPGPARETRLPSGEPKFAGDCDIPAEGKTMFSRFTRSIRIVIAKTQIKRLSSSGESDPSLWKRQKRGLSGFRPRESETEVPGRSLWRSGQNEVYPVRAGLCACGRWEYSVNVNSERGHCMAGPWS